MRVETFNYQLAGMRKPDNFIVYPHRRDDGSYLVQGDRTIATVHPQTCEGMLNWKGSHSKYAMHLMPMMGAEPFTFPREFVNLVINYQPSSGDYIGGGVRLA
jgi:hypothetical protein